MKKILKKLAVMLPVFLTVCLLAVPCLRSAAADGPVEAETSLFLFWPFEGSTVDISHHRMEIDTEGGAEGYVEGKSGKALEVYTTLIGDYLTEDIDLTEFTVAFWVKWTENSNGSYTVPFAISSKETSHHFEVYFTVDGDEGELAFYATGNGWNVEHIAKVESDEYCHIAAVKSSAGFRLFLNGEEVFGKKNAIPMKGLGDSEDYISICGLNDRSLTCGGEYDELLLADYPLPDELIAKLYSDPEAAHNDIVALVEANYPEGYEKPTDTPSPTPTPEPTAEPGTPEATEAPTETEAPTAASDPAKATPEKNDPKDTGSVKPWVIVAIASGVVIAGCAAAVILMLKKKKG